MGTKFRDSFGMDSKLNLWLSRVTDFILLNALWTVCSLPIITMGSAYAALNSVLLKYAAKEDISCVKDYFNAFKKNLKKTIGVSLLSGVLLLILAVDIYIAITIRFRAYIVMIGFAIFMILNILMTDLYYFIIVNQTSGRNTELLKTSYSMGMAFLPNTLVMVVLTLIPAAICYFNTTLFIKLIFVWMIGGISVTQWACILLFQKSSTRLTKMRQ